MILRSVMKHVRDQNWFAVGLDFLIVIVGVFIGIQVSNWNEVRRDEAVGVRYTDRLLTELASEMETWSRATTYYGTARKHAVSALEGFQQSPEKLDAQFLVDLYQASQRWNVTVLKGTFEELLSTGRIEMIADEETRQMLANYYGRTNSIALTLGERSDYRRLIREFMDHRVQTEIRSKCDDRWVYGDEVFVYLALPTLCEIDLPEELTRNVIVQLHANDDVQRKLRFHLSILESRLGTLSNATIQSDATRNALKDAAVTGIRSEWSYSSRASWRPSDE